MAYPNFGWMDHYAFCPGNIGPYIQDKIRMSLLSPENAVIKQQQQSLNIKH